MRVCVHDFVIVLDFPYYVGLIRSLMASYFLLA
jgi:hypothetical protein